MTTLTWTAQQAQALDRCARWLADTSGPQEFVIDGYAGTGKSTIARHLAESRKMPMFCAYTGKAASVLRKMGIPNASTIHALLYKPIDADLTRLHDRRADLAKAKHDGARPEVVSALEQEIALLMREARQPRFAFNEDSLLWQCDLIVCDESSMITERIRNDLARFGKKMLILGDPGQLPPVRGLGYYAQRPADVRLTEIRRQALDNPILRYATAAREGREIPFVSDGAFRRVRAAQVADAHYVAAVAAGAQLLSGRNETRNKLNRMIRDANGRASAYPEPGERVVVLQNNYEWLVFNGVTCDVLATTLPAASEGGGCLCTLRYDERTLEHVPVDHLLFEALAEGKPYERVHGRDTVPLDFGACLTVHKAQGSQWEHVVLYDDGFAMRDREMRRKWLYTAITRAAEKCTIVF